jgi:hypothetical protein
MWNWHRSKRGDAVTETAHRPRARSFEQLESRLAMAGNVLAHVSGGNLIVGGDDVGATITVSQPRPGQFTLTGNDTTINGSAQPATFTKVTGDLRFNFGAGDDSLQFDETSPISVRGNLSINGGKGSNTVAALGPGDGGGPGPTAVVVQGVRSASTQHGSLDVGGNLTILNLAAPIQNGGGDATISNGAGPAIQTIQLVNLDIRGNASIRNLGGAASVTMSVDRGGAPQPTPNSIHGDLIIFGGPGQVDQNSLSSLNVKGNVRIVNQANVDFTSINSVGASNVIGGDLRISDNQADVGQVFVSGTNIGGNLQIHETAASNGIVSLAASIGGASRIETGDGSDLVFVGEATFGGDFRLGTGNSFDAVDIGGPVRAITVMQFRIVPVVDQSGHVTNLLEAIQAVFVARGGPVTFHGHVTALFGQDDDTLTLATRAQVDFKKGALFDGQDGSNRAEVGTSNLHTAPTFAHLQVNAI